jgi:hypothetical protein
MMGLSWARLSASGKLRNRYGLPSYLLDIFSTSEDAMDKSPARQGNEYERLRRLLLSAQDAAESAQHYAQKAITATCEEMPNHNAVNASLSVMLGILPVVLHKLEEALACAKAPPTDYPFQGVDRAFIKGELKAYEALGEELDKFMASDEPITAILARLGWCINDAIKDRGMFLMQRDRA